MHAFVEHYARVGRLQEVERERVRVWGRGESDFRPKISDFQREKAILFLTSW